MRDQSTNNPSIGESGGAAERFVKAEMLHESIMPHGIEDTTTGRYFWFEDSDKRDSQLESLNDLAATQSSPAVSGGLVEAAKERFAELDAAITEVFVSTVEIDGHVRLPQGVLGSVIRPWQESRIALDALAAQLLQATGKEETDSGLEDSAALRPEVQPATGKSEGSGESDGPFYKYIAPDGETIAFANDPGRAYEADGSLDSLIDFLNKGARHFAANATPTPNQPTEGCDHDYTGSDIYPTSPPKKKCRKCGTFTPIPEIPVSPTEGKDGGSSVDQFISGDEKAEWYCRGVDDALASTPQPAQLGGSEAADELDRIARRIAKAPSIPPSEEAIEIVGQIETLRQSLLDAANPPAPTAPPQAREGHTWVLLHTDTAKFFAAPKDVDPSLAGPLLISLSLSCCDALGIEPGEAPAPTGGGDGLVAVMLPRWVVKTEATDLALLSDDEIEKSDAVLTEACRQALATKTPEGSAE